MRKSALVLFFAVVLGAVAAVLVWSYMQQLQQEAERIAQSGIGKPAEVAAIPVVVATQDIPARTKVTASDGRGQADAARREACQRLRRGE